MATVQTLAGETFEPEIPGRLMRIAGDIREAGGRAFLVGGWVRDVLLGTSCRDYDIEVYDLTQEVLLPILSKYGRTNLVGKAFGVIHLAMKGLSLDFSFPRTESKVGYGHRGFVVHTDEKLSFKEAALRRDFTINAMGMELPELTLCDPYGGIEDLKAHRLRHVGPAFVEDSLRILRGVQFASRFELTLAPETVELCRTLTLSDLSVERLFEEFKKWLLKPGKPSLGLKAFLDIKLDGYFPEVRPLRILPAGELLVETALQKGTASPWDSLGEFLDNLSRGISGTATSINGSAYVEGIVAKSGSEESGFSDEEKMVLMFSALLSGNVSPLPENDAPAYDGNAVMTFLTRITNEVKLIRGVPLLLKNAWALDPRDNPDDAAIRRLSNTLGGLRLWTVFVENFPLYNAELRQKFAAEIRRRSAALGVYEKAPQPYLTGKMLMDLGVKPGKQMGELIKASFELQLDGKILDASAALEWAKERVG